MFKTFFNNIVEQKFYLIIITAIIYILGLISFFNECPVFICSVLFFLSIIILWKNYLSPKIIIFWIFMFFLGFFNASLRIKSSDELSFIAPKKASIKGQVITIPDISSSTRERFFFKVYEINYDNKNKQVSAKTFVSINGNPDINIGDYYEIKGKLRFPLKVTNPSQFDYEKYLRNYNTYTTFYAEDYLKIDSKLSLKWKFLQGLNNKRKEILKAHSEHIKSPNIDILGGVVFGDDAVSPPDDIKQAFINSGILHILAASGMNVALIYGIFFFILKCLKIPYRLNNIIGILTIILYTLMTGMGPSVIRAAIILIFVIIGKLLNREAHNLSLLSLVAILMLLYNPAYINDVGFQLSFVVTFGLLIMASPILSAYRNKKRIIQWTISSIVIPIVAQIWVAPIQMFYFNTFCVYSIFANIAIMPFITLISFGGFISSVLAGIKPIAHIICLIFDIPLNWLLTCLVNISNFFSNLPMALISMPKPTLLQIITYYSILFIIVKIISFGFKKKYLVSICTLMIFLLLTLPKYSSNSELIFFDVQNADCILYKTPQNKYFIIDTGKQGFKGSKNQIQYILMEYLKDNGIKNIEGLIVTHFDSDHAGGAADLIKEINVKNVYVNSLNDKSKIAQEIYSLSSHINKSENNKIIYQENNIEIKTYIANLKEDKYENENSVITLINDNGYKILLMGDAGIEGFNKISKDIPKIDVFKVGHHGAKDVVNKEMIEKISPKYSIISTGINRYGHPNKATLEILKSTTILRTDRNNAIMIKNKNVFVYNKDKGFIKFSKYLY